MFMWSVHDQCTHTRSLNVRRWLTKNQAAMACLTWNTYTVQVYLLAHEEHSNQPVTYEKIFFLVFEVSRTKYYLYQIFDTRYSFLMLMRSDLRGDISIIVFWGKVTDVKNFKYTYLLENLHICQISLEMSIWYQIFGTSNILFWTLQKLKKNFLIDTHYKTWAVFSDITKKWKYFLNFPQGAERTSPVSDWNGDITNF